MSIAQTLVILLQIASFRLSQSTGLRRPTGDSYEWHDHAGAGYQSTPPISEVMTRKIKGYDDFSSERSKLGGAARLRKRSCWMSYTKRDLLI
jgi:hypothetical protein